jgi:large subunit ribosomal protein L19e
MLSTKKRMAAEMLKCSPQRIKLDPARLDEIGEAITKADIRDLIKDKAIQKKPERSTSRSRIRKQLIQKRKGRGKGPTAKKGKHTARLPGKEEWKNRVRKIRQFLRELKGKGMLDSSTYRDLYSKTKGGVFRSKRHIKLYIDEQGLIRKNEK